MRVRDVLWMVALVSVSASPAAWAKKAEAKVLVVVTTPEGDPVPGIGVRMEQVGKEKVQWHGLTNDFGEANFSVPGDTQVRTVLERDGWEIPSEPRSFTPTEGTSTGWSLRFEIEPKKVHLDFLIQNHDHQAEPDVLVKLVNTSTDESEVCRTTIDGKCGLVLPDGGEYRLFLAKFGRDVTFGTTTYHSGQSFTATRELDYRRFQGGDERTTMVVIEVRDPEGNPESGAEVRLLDQGGNPVQVGTTDSAGRLPVSILPGTQVDVKLLKYGLIVPGGPYTVPDQPTTTLALKADLKPRYRETVRLDVHFDTGSSALRPESRPALDEVYARLSADATALVEIAGHTDDVGDDAVNLALSRARANVVRDYLIDKGLEAGRLTAKGYGETEPLAGNDTEEGRQSNRRTEMRIIEVTAAKPAVRERPK